MRKKMFLTLCCSLSVIFLISYCLIYFIFHALLMKNIQQQQINLLQFNESIFTNYIDSFNMVPFQLINDEEIGNALNTDSALYLDMFRGRETLRKKFNKYLNQQLFSTNIGCRLILYLNKEIPLSKYCDAYTLSDNVNPQTSQVYTDTLITQEDWFQRTMKVTWSPYFFVNTVTNELCYAKCVQNYYLKTPSENGFGIVVISIPTSSILNKLSLDSITPNSCIILMNEYNEILYQHGNNIPVFSPDIIISGKASSDIYIEGKKYIKNMVSVKDDLYLTFITPYSDIEAEVFNSLNLYILFSVFTYLVLIFIIYIVSKRITAPIISFADLISKIYDTRTFDTSRLSAYKDSELMILCRSFTELIFRENTLIDRINEENKAKRMAVLHALQAQINPHFLYNALDVVSWMALSKQEDTIADVVSSISNMMHYSISHPDAPVTLEQELDNIHEFIRIYQLECPIEIQLDISVENKQYLTQIQIPKFTLQPLIENAVMHNPDSTSLSITIQICPEPTRLTISVIDNGIGAKPQKLNAYLNYEESDLTVSNGFGIRNVNERLKLHYSNDSCLTYKKTSEGYLMAIITIFNYN